MLVDQSFKEPLPKQVEFFDDGMCDGPKLVLGHQYLMYSSGPANDPISTRGCTRSRAVEDAADDLRFLKAYVDGRTYTHIDGTVRYWPDEAEDSRLGEKGRTPLKDVAVTISGEDGRTFQTKTDATGRYSVSNLTPGAYVVDTKLVGFRAGDARDEIHLMEKGCAVADVLMKVDRRVAGVVRSQDGRPVADALVEMIPTDRNRKPWEIPVLLNTTDDSGAYVIDGIPPGDYYLGINIHHTPTKNQPYAPTYFPNTRDRNSATPIHIASGVSVQSFDLVAPARLKIVRIRGRIVNASGSAPGVNAKVRIKGPGLHEQIEEKEIEVDTEGRFAIELCEGIHYSAFAFSGASTNTQLHSEPIEFVAGTSELHLTLNKTANEFLDLREKFVSQRSGK